MHFNKLLCFVFVASFSGLTNSETIIIYGNHAKPPKNEIVNGKPEGILIEMMQYIDEQLPVDFEYQLYPWNRAYANAINGRGGIIGLSKTSERQKIFDYSDVMYFDELRLVVMKGKEFDYQSIEDLRGKRVGYQRGASFDDEFSKARKELFIPAEDSGIDQRIIKLTNGRIDVAIIGPGTDGFNFAIQRNPGLQAKKDQFVILPIPFRRDPNYFGFAKISNKQDLINDINQILKQGFNSGKFQSIVDSYKSK